MSAGLVAEAVTEVRIRDFHFPEREATITGWITQSSRENEPAEANEAFEKIHRHAWGLWTAITAETNQILDRQRLRVFETWYTPDDLVGLSLDELVQNQFRGSRRRTALQPVVRFEAGAMTAPMRPVSSRESERVLGFVKFDRTAAEHIVRQGLLDASALRALVDAGAAQIPAFPATATTLKTVFQVLKSSTLVDGRYAQLKVWSGPPATVQPWGPEKWPGCVWVDLRDGGAGHGEIDGQGAADGSTRTAATTYPVSQFICFRLSADDVARLSRDPANADARPGDMAVLVAMHVAGKEISRWTWQTFWWTPQPDDPVSPSSSRIAALRPPELQGAPRHYAMTLGYSMLSPDQPYMGGENTGAAVYAYNPWLEARFGPAELPDSRPGVSPEGTVEANAHGVQSNCMSCHARANYNPDKIPTAPRYSGARYVDLADPQFAGTLQLDFLWSLAAEAR
jgi:hypothetical protein